MTLHDPARQLFTIGDIEPTGPTLFSFTQNNADRIWGPASYSRPATSGAQEADDQRERGMSLVHVGLGGPQVISFLLNFVSFSLRATNASPSLSSSSSYR